MIIENLTNAGYPPINGDTVRITYPNGNIEEKLYSSADGLTDPEVLPLVSASNVLLKVNGFAKQAVGDIYWLNQSVGFELTADLDIPTELGELATDMIIMAERVVDGFTPVDDHRFLGNINGGQLTISSQSGFGETGNYLILAARLNRGLERIGAPFRVAFDPIEFDVVRS